MRTKLTLGLTGERYGAAQTVYRDRKSMIYWLNSIVKIKNQNNRLTFFKK